MGMHVIITEDFEKWLRAIGYAESTVYGSVSYVRDFFTWLEPTPIKELSQINNQTIKSYHEYLQKRANKRQTGSLSNNYIISNINALKRFGRYLQQTGSANLEIDLPLKAIYNRNQNHIDPSGSKIPLPGLHERYFRASGTGLF